MLKAHNTLLYYVLKRVLKAVLTFIVVSLIIFFISIRGATNPIENKINALFLSKTISANEKIIIIEKFVKKNHTHLPLFYCSIEPVFFNDSIFDIYNPREKIFIEQLQYQFHNWNQSIKYYYTLKQLILRASCNDSLSQQSVNAMNAIFSFKTSEDFTRLNCQLTNIPTSDYMFFKENKLLVNEIIYQATSLNTKKNNLSYFIPRIHFYKNNQFHYWLFGNNDRKGIINGDFGTSTHSGESNNQLIIRNLKWSLFFSVFAIFIALVTSIGIGLGIASLKEIKRYELSKKTLLLLFSIPNFCICILSITLFSNTEFLNVLPSSGLVFSYKNSNDFNMLEIIPHIILPLICYSYTSIVFLTQYISTIARNEFNKDYVRSAHAKGISEFSILWKHVLKNCLVPIIQIIGLLFPYLVSGSVIVEVFFTLPGLGYQTVNAILNYDYSLLSALLFISTLFTLSVYLVTDVLIAFVDTRIILSKDV